MAKKRLLTEKSVYIHIEKTAKLIRERFNLILHQSGIKLSFEQWLILTAISRDQGIIQKDVARALGKEPASISRMINKLIDVEVVSRSRNAADGKSKKLYLTPKGYDYIEKAKPILDKEYKKIFSGIHEQELNLVNDILKRVVAQNLT